MRFQGLENVPAKGPFILAVNHQSFLDPILAGIALKGQLCFMARDTLFKSKIFGLLLSSVKAIPVRRGQADISSIKIIISRLKKGEGVCLFPEATRTTDGKIAPFKGGFGLLCRRGNSPIIPVLIDGAFECWPRHQKLFKPGSKITVTYGKPISAEQVMQMEDDDFAKLLTDTLRNMQSQIRISEGKQPFNYA
ncbi:MAG: lysophospholipid acyltransferase family protein [Sedimentisphaerales bacterium]|jgi:1-acyl-sn-glycerol-3-phosphate acyltransferase